MSLPDGLIDTLKGICGEDHVLAEGSDLEPFGHDEFARLIAHCGKPGSVFLVYGMNRIFPQYDGLELLESLSPLGGVLAVYRKTFQVAG